MTTPDTTQKSTKSRAVPIGIALSLAYISLLLLVGYKIIALPDGFATFAEPLKVNEWGDFFAGFLSPLALCWFIWTLKVQRDELALTRNEMKDARQVWTEQKEQQKKLAIATEAANTLQSKALFFAQYPHLDEAIEDASCRMIDTLAKRLENDDFIYVVMKSKNRIGNGSAESRSTELFNILNTSINAGIGESISAIVQTSPDYDRFVEAYKLLSTQASTLGLTPVIRAHQRDCAQILGLDNPT